MPSTHFFIHNTIKERDYLKPVLTSKHSFIDSYTVEEKEGKWIITKDYERLHARRTVELYGMFFLQVKETSDVELKKKMYFDGQSEPIGKTLKVHIDHNVIDYTFDELYNKLNE